MRTHTHTFTYVTCVHMRIYVSIEKKKGTCRNLVNYSSFS